MRRTEKPSARFLGLLHGQAVIRSDAKALAMIEARAHARGIMPAVARHSSSYIVRRFSLDWMQSQDHEPALPKIRRQDIGGADHPILRALKESGNRSPSHSTH
jgi:hypothetical protein